MAKFIGEVKVEQFLQAIIEKFPYEFIEKNDFMYTFQQNNSICSIGYEKQKTLFSKTYNLTIKIEKTVQTENEGKEEVRYLFHKQKWTSKKDNRLLKTANKFFRLNWSELDIEKLSILEERQKRTLKMSILPGSYNVLLFPLLIQGIEMYPQEMKCLIKWIDSISSYLDRNIV